MFRSVVLPAPFGPMTDTIDPCRTAKSTPRTACTPPKDFDVPWTSSCKSGPAAPRSTPSAQPALTPAIMLDVPVALAMANAGETQVELLDVLVVADHGRVPVQDDPPALHHVGILGEAERHGRVLLREQHG